MLTYYRTFENVHLNKEPCDYIINRCFSHLLNDKSVLIATSHGGWIILTRNEYGLLLEGNVEKGTNLYSALERTGIILTRNNQRDLLKISCEQHAYLNQVPNQLVIWWMSNNDSDELSDETRLDERLEEIGFKAIDFFLSIPRLCDRVYVEFRGDCLSQYHLVQQVMDYAMIAGGKKRKEIIFTIISTPHLMTDEIAMDILRRQVSYHTYFDGSTSAINGIKKIRGYLQKGPVSPMEVIAFPSDYIDQEPRLVDECVALGLNRIRIKYADASHPVERYRKTGLSSEDYYNFWTNALELIIEQNRNGISLTEGQTQDLLQNILVPGANSAKARRPCGAGVSQLVVDLAGRILACYCADWLEMGSVFTDTYDGVITSTNGVTARCLASDLLPKCSTCAFNAYCGHCSVRTLQQHGSSLLEAPDDFECQSYIQMIPYLFNKLKDVKDAELLAEWV